MQEALKALIELDPESFNAVMMMGQQLNPIKPPTVPPNRSDGHEAVNLSESKNSDRRLENSSHTQESKVKLPDSRSNFNQKKQREVSQYDEPREGPKLNNRWREDDEEDEEGDLANYSPKKQDQTQSDLSGVRFDKSDYGHRTSKNHEPPYQRQSRETYYPESKPKEESRNEIKAKQSNILPSKNEDSNILDGEKYIEHDIKWGDDDNDWGNPNPKPKKEFIPRSQNDRDVWSENSRYDRNDRQPDDHYNNGGQRGRRGGNYNNRGRNYQTNTYQGKDYRNTQQPYSGNNGRNERNYYREDNAPRKGGARTILDTQTRKTDFTSIADYFSKKMIGDDSHSHKDEKDPGPRLIKTESNISFPRIE